MSSRKPAGGLPAPRDARHANERAALVGLISGALRRVDAEQSLDELAGLAEAAGADVVLRMLQERARPDAGTFIGAGKVSSLAAACAEADVDVVIVDHDIGGRSDNFHRLVVVDAGLNAVELVERDDWRVVPALDDAIVDFVHGGRALDGGYRAAHL